LGGGGAEQKETFEKIKEYLAAPPVLRAPKLGEMFKLYIAAKECVIGTTMLQEKNGKEFLVIYISWPLLDAETRYVFIEKFGFFSILSMH
jgi:hypothetical protein